MTVSRCLAARVMAPHDASRALPRHSLVRTFAALLLLAVLCGCARREEPSPVREHSVPAAPSATAEKEKEPPGHAAPPSAAANWAATLRSVHTRLDAAKGAPEQRAALSEVERLFESAPPGGDASAPELLPLRQDLASRAARIELQLGHGASAREWARRGLALSAASSLFRANLLLDAADAQRLEGDETGARASLLEAMQINQHLLDEELENP